MNSSLIYVTMLVTFGCIITQNLKQAYKREETFDRCKDAVLNLGEGMGHFSDYDVVGCFTNEEDGLKHRVTLKHSTKDIKRCVMTLHKPNSATMFAIKQFENGTADCHKMLKGDNYEYNDEA